MSKNDIEGFAQLNIEFHESIYKATKRYLEQVLKGLQYYMKRT